jgi:hypothetical protein
MQKLIFLCVASAVLLFSIIVVNIGPVLGGLVGGNYWSYPSCSLYSDNYKYIEKKDYNKTKKEKDLDGVKKDKNRCNRKKAMVSLEYVAFDLNIICGGICALLGLLVVLKVGDIDKITGLIGLGCGVVGFVLTLVYVIESGLVFNDIEIDPKLKIDSDGAVLEWDNSKDSYVCIFYEKDNEESIYRKYSDYGNKYLSYNKDVYFWKEDKKYEIDRCNLFGYGISPINYYDCEGYDDKTRPRKPKQPYLDPNDPTKKLGDCNKLYYFDTNNSSNYNKILYDRWLTSIILSCFIFLLNIGLAIFGFLLFNGSGKTNL